MMCNTSRYQSDLKKDKRVSHKMLCYFPLKLSLQRLYMFTKTSNDMRWQHNGRVKNRILRAPIRFKGMEAF